MNRWVHGVPVLKSSTSTSTEATVFDVDSTLHAARAPRRRLVPHHQDSIAVSALFAKCVHHFGGSGVIEGSQHFGFAFPEFKVLQRRSAKQRRHFERHECVGRRICGQRRLRLSAS